MRHDEGETSYIVVVGMMNVEEWKVAVVLFLGVEKAKSGGMPRGPLLLTSGNVPHPAWRLCTDVQVRR